MRDIGRRMAAGAVLALGAVGFAVPAPAAPPAAPHPHAAKPHQQTHGHQHPNTGVAKTTPATTAAVRPNQATHVNHSHHNNLVGAALAVTAHSRLKAASHTNHNAALSALHHAHVLLATANHDYNGHRAKAAAAVSQAIRALGGTHHGHHATNAIGAAGQIAAGVGNRGKVHEPQAQSDAQLKQAGQLLAGVQGHIPAGHAAHGHVQHALTELNTALKIR